MLPVFDVDADASTGAAAAIAEAEVVVSAKPSSAPRVGSIENESPAFIVPLATENCRPPIGLFRFAAEPTMLPVWLSVSV